MTCVLLVMRFQSERSSLTVVWCFSFQLSSANFVSFQLIFGAGFQLIQNYRFHFLIARHEWHHIAPRKGFSGGYLWKLESRHDPLFASPLGAKTEAHFAIAVSRSARATGKRSHREAKQHVRICTPAQPINWFPAHLSLLTAAFWRRYCREQVTPDAASFPGGRTEIGSHSAPNVAAKVEKFWPF